MDDDELALAVGRIVVTAAWVDEVCADLAVEFQRERGSVRRKYTAGASGRQLAGELRDSGAEAWAEEYRALFERRNAVVHGRWYQDGEDGQLQSHRSLLRATWAGAADVTRWDEASLVRLAADLEDFFVRARSELFNKTGISTWLDRRRPPSNN